MERKLIGKIRTRQLRFLGHVIRKDGLENLALTGKIEGKEGNEVAFFIKNLLQHGHVMLQCDNYSVLKR